MRVHAAVTCAAQAPYNGWWEEFAPPPRGRRGPVVAALSGDVSLESPMLLPQAEILVHSSSRGIRPGVASCCVSMPRPAAADRDRTCTAQPYGCRNARRCVCVDAATGEAQVLTWLQDMCSGVAYLHSELVMHRYAGAQPSPCLAHYSSPTPRHKASHITLPIRKQSLQA